jgi:hypothetical protein
MIAGRARAVFGLAAPVAPGAIAQPPAPPYTPVTPGELIVDSTTLIELGFEWFIAGDANRNASV